jgi:hypothetical protein
MRWSWEIKLGIAGFCILCGCGTVDKMNAGLENSIQTVSDNTKAVKSSTETILANSQSVDETTKILQLNSAGITQNIGLMQETARAIHINTQAIERTTALMETATGHSILLGVMLFLILLILAGGASASYFLFKKIDVKVSSLKDDLSERK